MTTLLTLSPVITLVSLIQNTPNLKVNTIHSVQVHKNAVELLGPIKDLSCPAFYLHSGPLEAYGKSISRAFLFVLSSNMYAEAYCLSYWKQLTFH